MDGGWFTSLEEHERRRVTDYVFVADEIFRAEIAVVFGMTRWPRPLERALRLHRDGTVRRLLLTGGYNPHIGGVEALEMEKAALAAGVPAEDLIVDPEARNTLENCINAARDCRGAGSAILVAIHYHARRVRLTARRCFDPSVRLGLATYPSLFYGAADWHLSDRGRRDVGTELRKIATYFPEDFAALGIPHPDPVAADG